MEQIANATAQQITVVNFISQQVPWMALNFQDKIATDIMIIINDWYNVHGGVNSSITEFATFLGCDPSWVQLTYDFFGGIDSLVEHLEFGVEAIPFMPHPKQIAGYNPVFILLTIVATLFLVTRFFSRISIQGTVKHYDWVILSGFVLTLGLGLMDCIELNGAQKFRGAWDQTFPQQQATQSTSLVVQILGPLAALLVKFSLLLFYRSLTDWKPIRIAVYAVAGLVTANMLVMIIVYLNQCNVVDYWNGAKWMTAVCPLAGIPIYQMTVATGSINIATDVIIWLLPIPMVWKLPLGTREKVLSLFTFGVGVIAVVASGFKLYWQRYQFNTSLPVSYGSVISMWTVAELYLAIICASVPAIRALIVKKVPTLLSGGRSGASDDQYGSDSNDSIQKKSKGSKNDNSNFSPTEEKTGTWVASNELNAAERHV